jgi:S-DNA-T family DNA segregation ATPase FtsK/SpoIIIE
VTVADPGIRITTLPDNSPRKGARAAWAAASGHLGVVGGRLNVRRLAWSIVKLVAHIPIGVVRVIVWLWRWVMLGEAAGFRAAALNDPLNAGDAWLRQRKEQRVARKERAQVLGIVTGLALVLMVVAAVYAPRVLTTTAIGGATWLGWYGWTWRHETRELIPTLTDNEAPRLNYDAVIDALSRLGIAPLAKAIKDDPTGAIRWVTPIARDGRGRGTLVRAELPAGVKATDVVRAREGLASALARPLGCVWPSVDVEAHPGRLNLYVADEDMAKAKQDPWPYLKEGVGDYFADFQIGTDPMGRPVRTRLDEMNSLFGGQPGFGKTSGMSVNLGWSALDPTVEHWIFDLKGLGDWQDAPLFAARYAAGQDDDTADAVMAALVDLRKEIGRRAKIMEKVPREKKRDNKVTRHLANAGIGLHPLHVVIDEAQEICLHATHGKKAGDLLVACSKLGRALGVHLQVATQRPDADSIPTALRANIATRSCFRVADRHTNDMILGDGMRNAGLDAGQFTTRDKGIAWVIGATSHDAEPTVTRYHYLDGHDRRRIFTRARAEREVKGLLRGLAAGVDPEPAADTDAADVVADIYTVTRGREVIHTVNLLELLRTGWPNRYGDLADRGLAELLRPHGITSEDVWDGPLDGGDKSSRKGYKLAPLHALARQVATAA